MAEPPDNATEGAPQGGDTRSAGVHRLGKVSPDGLLERLPGDPDVRALQVQLGRSRARALAPRRAMDALGDQLVTILRTSTPSRKPRAAAGAERGRLSGSD